MASRYFSNIYWHFTGSNYDRGQPVARPDDMGPPKEPAEAVAIVEKILESRRLIARAQERLPVGLATERFCSVTDIPIKDLPSHAAVYGKVAIGFRAATVHREFVPVLYVPRDGSPISALLRKEAASTPPPLDGIGRFFVNYMKMTDFTLPMDDSLYREREWRRVGDFPFLPEDIEAVLAPREFLPRLRRRLFEDLRYPGTVSVISWEFVLDS